MFSAFSLSLFFLFSKVGSLFSVVFAMGRIEATFFAAAEARDRVVKHTEQMAYAMAASPCAVASFGGVANRAAGTSARRPCRKSSTGS